MFKLNKQYHQKEILVQRIILFAFGLAMIVLYFSQILGFIGRVIGICSPFLIGGFIGFVLWVISNNIYVFFTRFLKLRENKFTRFACNVLAVLVLIALISVFIFGLLPKVIDSLRSIMTDLPGHLYGLYTDLLDVSASLPEVHKWLAGLNFDPDVVSQSLEEFMGWLSRDIDPKVMSNIYAAVSNVFSWAFNLMIACMFSIILLFNKNRVVKEARSFLQAYLPDRFYTRTIHIIHLIISTFKSYIGGSCLECLILGSLVAAIGSILQVPYALLAGLVVGIGSLVPMFGALCAALLVTLFLALESPSSAFTFLIMFICIQQVEGNFIYPNVVGKSIGLPAFYVVVAVTLGASMGGILGMIVFIPIASCFYQIISEDVTQRLKDKKKAKTDHEQDSTDH